MRKRIINQRVDEIVPPASQKWLNLENLAQVDITSEDPAHPIESALTNGTGWRAATPGEQTIRLLFDEPQSLKHIHLEFDEDRHERTHEFVLRCSIDGGRSYQELVRQQYTFSPSGTTREVEDYDVNLNGVTILELWILPDISGGSAYASLTRLQLA
jgi:hypothetical protein